MTIYKTGVVVGRYLVHPLIWKHLEDVRTFDKIFLEHGGRMAIVTSVREGSHMENSLHWWGRAVDLRANDLSSREQQDILEALRDQLGDDWDILLHGQGANIHYHIEYDPE